MTLEPQFDEAIESLSHGPGKREGFLAFAALGAVVAYGAWLSWADMKEKRDGRSR